jgi:hypothetical protein
MNVRNKGGRRVAGRYHYNPYTLCNNDNFVTEPHSGIISETRAHNILDMISKEAVENQRTCENLARGDINGLNSAVRQSRKYHKCVGDSVHEARNDRLDKWIMDTADGNNSISNPARIQHKPTCDVVKCYEMPRKLDWDFGRIYDIQPVGYEELISIRGVRSSVC